MAQLSQDYQKFIERNAEIVVVGPEDHSAFERYWHQHQLPFIGLPDPTHRVAKQYGQQIKLLKFGRMPALLVIDTGMNIRYTHYGHSMRDIPSNAEILSVLDTLS